MFLFANLRGVGSYFLLLRSHFIVFSVADGDI